MTAFELSKKAAALLEKAGVPDAAFDARSLVESVADIPHEKFILLRDNEVTDEQVREVEALCAKRALGVPLQYLLGSWEFFGYSFAVGEGVLIPRPETEELVSLTLEKMKEIENPVVFDLCAGTGCIGISVKHERPDASVYLIEKSDEAMSFLETNKIRNGFGSSIVSVKYDILDGFPSFLPEPDVIISNPPYIPTAELVLLQKEVGNEPPMALDGGKDGIDFYLMLAEKWFPYIKAGGFISVECGEGQAETIAGLFGENSTIIKDFYGAERFVFSPAHGRKYDI